MYLNNFPQRAGVVYIIPIVLGRSVHANAMQHMMDGILADIFGFFEHSSRVAEPDETGEGLPPGDAVSILRDSALHESYLFDNSQTMVVSTRNVPLIDTAPICFPFESGREISVTNRRYRPA